ASEKNKINVHAFRPHNCQCYFFSGAIVAPEAAPRIDQRSPMLQSTWTFPATNRLLFEAGSTVLWHTSEKLPQPGTTQQTISVLEASTNFRYRSNATAYTATGAWGADEYSQAN